MKNSKTNSKAPKAHVGHSKAPPAANSSAQRGQDRSRRSIVLPPDPVAQRRTIKDTYINVLGALVFGAQTRNYVQVADPKAAEAFIAAIRESVQPRDALEEMTLVQLAWLHARIAKLSVLAIEQTQTSNVRVVNDACDRAANTFRRMMLALAEYRRPRQAAGFVAIKQANVANQQVVQNVENQTVARPDFPKPVASNEQGSAAPQALPAVSDGPGIATSVSAAEQAVAAQQRPQDGEG